MSRIAIGAVGAAVVAVVIFGTPSKPPPFGLIGWIGLACMLAAQAIGAVVGLREFIAERAEHHREDAREVPASNGIQVLGTFLDRGEGDR